MSEYAILLTALLTSFTVVGGLILGAIYFTHNAIKSDIAQLRADVVAVDAKVERVRLDLDAKIDNEITELRSEMNAGFARLDAKIDNDIAGLRSEMNNEMAGLRSEMNNEMAGLRSEMNNEMAGLRSEMNAGFARLDAKIDSRSDSLRSDLGGRIDANTEKLSELATEVQVHLRTHHLIGEIERITTPPEQRAEEEQAVEETNQSS